MALNLPNPQSLYSRAPVEIRYALILTLVMTAGGLILIGSIPLSLFDKASVAVSFGLLLLPYLLFASRHFLEWLRQQTARSVFVFPLMLMAAYVLYGLGPGRFRIPESLVVPAYLAFPILFSRLAAKRGEKPNHYDFLTIAFLYLPVEMAALARAWRPADQDLPSPSHAFTQLVGINLALFCFMAVRPVDGIGFTFRLERRDVILALVAFCLFFPFALVVGTATGFVPFRPHPPDLALIVPVVLGKTLMVALPEEILFRGLIQNLLQRTPAVFRGHVPAILIASVIFGFSHVNNHPLFDWRYISLATVAGIAYGTVYRRTGKVTASTITHGLVDVVWKLFF